ncbi:CHAP domain-containing protein [Salinibacterium xinjiangense]|uniref:CHAP domain-containing protein n=1 Tax=Salinibacterium xinjiangense TaxID=386302 RepID=A0A2C8YAD6_9MICO|nr:CHAP domain-containing protein [Salinibacterium xinjiangense]
MWERGCGSGGCAERSAAVTPGLRRRLSATVRKVNGDLWCRKEFANGCAIVTGARAVRAAGWHHSEVSIGRNLRTRLGAVTASAVLAIIVGSLTPAGVAAAPTAPGAIALSRTVVVCTTDSCDGGLWQAARGASDQISYWGMGAGHNCTNFVAWKLISNGVSRPNIGLGDAGQWAESAIANGIGVDRVPAVGAVAQWDAYASNVGMYGHVAYVEKVNADGTILISEDAWRPNNKGGPLTFKTVDAATVSNFIHFGDTNRWIREVIFGAPTPVSVAPVEEQAVQPGDVAPSIPPQEIPHPSFVLPGEAPANPFILPAPLGGIAGWTVPDAVPPTPEPTPEPTTAPGAPEPTPVPSEPTPEPVPTGPAPAPVDPTPVPAETPTLTPTPTALPLTGEPGAPVWQERSTGLLTQPSAMSAVAMRAVDAGDSVTGTAVAASTQLVFADGGTLKTATRSVDGWAVTDTAIPSRSRKLVAVDMGGASPQVVSIDDGQLFLTAASRTGWQKMPTGIKVSGEIAALDTGGLWPTIMVSQNGKLFQVRRGMAGWKVTDTGIAVTGDITAVNVGGSLPQVFAIEGGVLQQVWADALGWHRKSTGIEADGAISAVVVDGAVQVILNEDGVVNQVTLDSSGWHRFSTAIRAGAESTPVDIGLDHPLIIQAG